MINVSNEFKNVVSGQNRTFYGSAEITLSDSTVLNLDSTQITGLKIEDAVNPTGKFTIGSAIINKLTLSINNLDDSFSDYDFTDAVIRPSVGLQLSETIETLPKGVFTADDPNVRSSVITLTALDNMVRFDKPFKDVTILFPTTASLLLSAVCLHCGVSLVTTTFLNDDFEIATRPIDDAINCREIISWIAGLSGNFARCNTSGDLELKWFNFEVFEQTGLNGGRFDETTATSYQSGDTADGGNLTDYTSGDSVDGGIFSDMTDYHHIYALNNFACSTDDVVITGIKVTDASETPTEALFGTSGYVISLEGNKLIQNATDAQTIADSIGAKIVGMRFRPCTFTTISDPCREAGDVAFVTDRKQNTHQVLLSSVSSAIYQNDKISCNAESASRNSSTRYSEISKAIIEARKNTQAQLTAYDLEMQRLTNLMTYSFGVYKTEEVLEDGSTIYYMHDKPTLAESTKIWKMTADAFAVSSDGGETWNAGFDVDGNVIVNILSAIGIKADWVSAGKLMSTDGATLIDMAYGVANSDNLSFTDNIQTGFPLTMPFNIDDSVSKINKVLLKFTQQKFRTYSTTASSGGGSSTSTSPNVSVTTGIYGNTNLSSGTGMHSHSYDFTINVLPEHSHNVNFSSHSHGLDFGIQEQNISNNEITIYVDNTLRSTVSDLQGIVDLTAYVTTSGWHTIEIRSTTLKRISAQINIKSYIRS